jgi:arylsulfatase
MPRATGGTPSKYNTANVEHPELYDLLLDPSELQDVASEHPEVVAQLMTLVEKARADLGDSQTGRTGANLRSPGRVER